MYNKRCHTSYNTNYETTQEEECIEKFKKVCFIDYKTVVFNQTVTVCKEALLKDCDVKGSESCKTEFKTVCSDKQDAHEVVDDVVECKTEIETKCSDEISGYTSRTKCSQWPRKVCSISKKNKKKYALTTSCRKEPIELCAPAAGCRSVPGQECREKVVTLVQKVPKEECFLAPHRTCKFVTKLMPKLDQAKQCSDVPQEACTRSRVKVFGIASIPFI